MRHPLPLVDFPQATATPRPVGAGWATLRLVMVLMVVLQGVITMTFWFRWCTPARQQQLVQRWAARLLRALGLRATSLGHRQPDGPLLLVANHISWLDIVALHATGYCRFIAKDDVRGWPIVGWLAHRAGTLFIARGARRDAVRIVQHMREHLQQQQVLAVFPEGTTSEGRDVLPFHANLLQAAIDTNAAVQPLGLRYHQPGAPHSHAASFVGEDSLIESLWRVARAHRLHITITHGQPEQAQGRSRQEWATALRQRVQLLRQTTS